MYKLNPFTGELDLAGNQPAIRYVYLDAHNLYGVTGTAPTAVAATEVQVSSATGSRCFSLLGASDTNIGAEFKIPMDYRDGGVFKLIYSVEATSANSFVIYIVLSVRTIGGSINTQTETLTKQTIVAGTLTINYETADFIPSTSLSAGQIVLLRVIRPANTDVDDTYTNAVLLTGIQFQYNT